MTFNKADEKRQFHRVLYNVDAKLGFNEQFIPCKVIDLSLNGCLLQFEDSELIQKDHTYRLYLELSVDVDISMELNMCHLQDNKAGFICSHIDIDSISQLRRLVELNLGDSHLLERDLRALFDITETTQ